MHMPSGWSDCWMASTCLVTLPHHYAGRNYCSNKAEFHYNWLIPMMAINLNRSTISPLLIRDAIQLTPFAFIVHCHRRTPATAWQLSPIKLTFQPPPSVGRSSFAPFKVEWRTFSVLWLIENCMYHFYYLCNSTAARRHEPPPPPLFDFILSFNYHWSAENYASWRRLKLASGWLITWTFE